MRLDYRSPQGETTSRLFDTYGLLWRAGRWYALGHCHLRRAVRSFRLDRVLAAVPVDASFARPDHFDALEHMNAAIARLPRVHAVDVLLHTDLDTARRRWQWPSAYQRPARHSRP